MGFDARTPVPTTAGWLPAALLKPGDEVFNFEGHPTKVVSTQVYTPRECYKVWFQGGLTLVVDGKTGLPVYDRSAVKKLMLWKRKTIRWDRSRIRPLGVRAIMERKFGACKMPNCSPIKPKERQLPIPPYDFGRWLMDRSYKRRMSNTDVTRELIEWYPVIPTDIPEEYLFGSFWQRLQLLRGITADRTKCYDDKLKRFTIYSPDYKIARQIQQLVESLGNHSMFVQDDKNGQHRVIFRTLLRIHPLQTVPDRPYTTETRRILKIEPVPPRECIYVKVEDDSNTFLVSEGFFGVSL